MHGRLETKPFGVARLFLALQGLGEHQFFLVQLLLLVVGFVLALLPLLHRLVCVGGGGGEEKGV